MNNLQIKPFIKKTENTRTINRPVPYKVFLNTSDNTAKRVRVPKNRHKKITHTKEAFICYGLGCLVIGGMIGLLSSLVGHTLLEQSRRDQIRMKEKVVSLKKEIGYLKGKIDKIKYHESIDQWADSKGMVNDRLTQPKTEEIAPLNLLKDAYVASF